MTPLSALCGTRPQKQCSGAILECPITPRTCSVNSIRAPMPLDPKALGMPRRCFRTGYLCYSSASQDISAGLPTPQQQDASSLDVSATVVNTAFRVRMDDSSAPEDARISLRILFVSESGVCRAPLAVAAFNAAARERGLDPSSIECSAAACRDYSVDCPAEPATEAAALAMGWSLPESYTSRCFLPSSDLARQDLILVMDKFTAADVLREASVFDTIYLKAGFSGKVRKLGEFHPLKTPGRNSTNGIENYIEIEDPLYGNYGGDVEAEAVLQAAQEIEQCCKGLADWVVGLQEKIEGSKGLRGAVGVWLGEAEGVEWMKPPLLSPR